MRWLLCVLVVACRGEATTSGELVARAAAAIRARGPVPVSTSPDGERVMIESLGEHGFRLDVVARSTGVTIAHREDDDPAIAPVWRRDGGAIAYFQARSHRRAYDLRIWDFDRGDGTAGVPITSTAFARFAPDGARLAYLASDAQQQRTLKVTGRDRALAQVADHAEAEWSPDGRQLATATAAAPGALTVIDVASAAATAIPVVDGELEDLAWSADGGTILVTGRARGAPYVRGYRVRLADRTVVALPAEAGDVHAPQLAGDEIAYHVERDGERRIYFAGAPIGRPDTSARLVGYAHGHAIVVYRPRTGPAYLAEVAVPATTTPPTASTTAATAAATPTADDTTTPTAASTTTPTADGTIPTASLVATMPPAPTGTPATRIDLPARDGVALPAYLWRARAAVGAVLIIHGGPALHASPAWNEKTQLLVDAGFDVLKLDYRGSTGHGAAFEALGTLGGRLDDVRAARDYLIRLGHASDHVVLLGESYGAGLVAAASDGTSPIVLVATQPLPARPTVARCPVLAFHGADDDISPSGAAHAHLARLFGESLRWRLLPYEGHNLARTESWAAVYAAILQLRDHGCR